MKKISLICLGLAIGLAGFAQTEEENEALGLVRRNAATLGLSAEDITNAKISSTYQSPESGLRMVYLQQTYKSIPVNNQLQVIAFRNGVPVSVTGGRIRNIENLAVPQSGNPATTAVQAVQAAFTESQVTGNSPIVPVSVSDNGRKVQFTNLGVSYTDIAATLVWAPNDQGAVQLAWEVELSPKGTSDHWLVRVNAGDNSILSKHNYTVYCNWQHSENEMACNTPHTHHFAPAPVPAKKNTPQQPFIVNGATYKVIPFPAESPQHTGGTPANRTDPWLLAPVGSNATSLKWHSNGTTDYTITRGNNVWAYEDRNADNIAGAADTSTTADPLTFTKLYDFAQEPIVNVNQRSATTNLFYWNNIIHDLFYLYGFDEVSGNFQVNNQGRGGAGNDAVNAEAQDGSGTNNANFNTPVDGSSGRMQMYLWNAPTPDRDGDLDNGIIIHEYGHGISNRLTGGPANSSCLGNQEQMGEGWSDYFALMLTQDWATSAITDGFNKPRGIGTYALEQPVTGVGIRQYPYTTNMAVNPFTYTNITTVAVPHGVGSVWCTMLWDMTWDMIQLDGINPNIYNPAGVGGNSAALKLVVEGLRLQPCSPGFVDGRNAILKADTLLYGARYSCIIWKAFARRGVGYSASQGLSTSRSDQTVAFDEPSYDMSFAQSVNAQTEGQNITYTVTTRALCQPVANMKVVDTLPANVTYVSGGTYNAGDRTVTFSGINIPAGNSQNSVFTVKVNNGAYFPPVTHLNEQVTGTTIPAGWTATSTTACVWRVSNTLSASSPNSFFSRDTTIASEQILVTSGSYAINGLTTLSFQHNYNTESGWDGGVVEISVNGGVTWTDLGNYIVSNSYNNTLGTGSALAGRRAFSGNSGGFVLTQIDLSAFRGQTIRIRFRFASDTNTGGTGWYVDNISMISEAAVITTAGLFNNSNVLQTSRSLSAKISLSAVPLRLIAFSGYANNTDAVLQWVTENEENMRSYELERSSDGLNFTPVALLNANNTLQRSEYRYTDANILAQNRGAVYYRLRMADRNGNIDYSRIVRINTGKETPLTLAPNPAKNQLTVSGFTGSQRYDATIADVTGKTVFSGSVSFLQNTIDVSKLEKGVYFLQLVNKDKREIYRFVKE